MKGTYTRQTTKLGDKTIKEVITVKYADGSTEKIIIDCKKHKIKNVIELSDEAIEELRRILNNSVENRRIKNNSKINKKINNNSVGILNG